MAEKKSNEGQVEVVCEILLSDVSADEFKQAVEDAIAYVREGNDLESFDAEGHAVAKKVRGSKFASTVKVKTDGMGTGHELVDMVFQLVTNGGASVVAYDVWKHIALPQLQARWGKQALIEKAKREKKAEKKKEKEKVAAGKGEKKSKKKKSKEKEHKQGEAKGAAKATPEAKSKEKEKEKEKEKKTKTVRSEEKAVETKSKAPRKKKADKEQE